MKSQQKPLLIIGAVFVAIALFFILHGASQRNAALSESEEIPTVPRQEFLSPRTGMMERVAPLPALKEPVPDDALRFAALARRLQMQQDVHLLGRPDKVQQRDNGNGYGANNIETTYYFEKNGGTVIVRYSGLGLNTGVDVL